MSWEQPKEDKSEGSFRDPYASGGDQNGEFVGEGDGKGDTFTAGGWDDLDTEKTPEVRARRVVIGPDTSQPTAQQRKVPAAILCSAITVVSGLGGGMIGGVIGVLKGFSEGRQMGARGTDLARFVGSRSMGTAWQFGSWLGCYGGVRCSMTHWTGKDGVLNAMVAGGVAGSLPVISSRNPRMIAGSMLSSALIMGAIDAVYPSLGVKNNTTR